jgi:hypothetical protein
MTQVFVQCSEYFPFSSPEEKNSAIHDLSKKFNLDFVQRKFENNEILRQFSFIESQSLTDYNWIRIYQLENKCVKCVQTLLSQPLPSEIECILYAMGSSTISSSTIPKTKIMIWSLSDSNNLLNNITTSEITLFQAHFQFLNVFDLMIRMKYLQKFSHWYIDSCPNFSREQSQFQIMLGLYLAVTNTEIYSQVICNIDPKIMNEIWWKQIVWWMTQLYKRIEVITTNGGRTLFFSWSILRNNIAAYYFFIQLIERSINSMMTLIINQSYINFTGLKQNLVSAKQWNELFNLIVPIQSNTIWFPPTIFASASLYGSFFDQYDDLFSIIFEYLTKSGIVKWVSRIASWKQQQVSFVCSLGKIPVIIYPTISDMIKYKEKLLTREDEDEQKSTFFEFRKTESELKTGNETKLENVTKLNFYWCMALSEEPMDTTLRKTFWVQFHPSTGIMYVHKAYWKKWKNSDSIQGWITQIPKTISSDIMITQNINDFIKSEITLEGYKLYYDNIKKPITYNKAKILQSKVFLAHCIKDNIIVLGPSGIHLQESRNPQNSKEGDLNFYFQNPNTQYSHFKNQKNTGHFHIFIDSESSSLVAMTKQCM